MAYKDNIPAEFQDPKYKVRRFQNWMLVGVLYSLFYMTRYNFSALAPVLQGLFGWTKNDLGLFETILPLVYGLSVFFNGPLAEKIGGRKAFLIGAVGVVLANGAFGAMCLTVLQPAVMSGTGHERTVLEAASLAWGVDARTMAWIMAIMWGVNGYFQSFGALAIVKINAQWFHIRERGAFSAIFGVLIRFGLILAFSGAPFIAAFLPVQWAFWIPALLVALFFFLNLFFVKETPEEAGYPSRDTGDAVVGEAGQKVTTKMVLIKIFTSWHMWMIAIASMMIGLVRRSTVDSWWPMYFKESYEMSGTDFVPQLLSWSIAALGIAGGFAFGYMSDRIFKSRRAPVVVIGFIGMVVCLVAFYGSDALALGPYGAVVCLACLSFFVNGAHGMIGGAASMDFGGRKGVATAAGLFDGMQYLSAAVTGVVVAWVTTNHGWQWWKLWALPWAVIGGIVMATLWNVIPRGKGGH
ncbi:MAG TPA: MFS transporter [Myxococcota bacterium]|nr:MFS transporter [Myxococcota bacterium]HRY94864.1 MFS transporter [Myxococcota bacterium]HSA23164.1 MFS transporter [Myxococcota bacterium]